MLPQEYPGLTEGAADRTVFSVTVALNLIIQNADHGIPHNAKGRFCQIHRPWVCYMGQVIWIYIFNQGFQCFQCRTPAGVLRWVRQTRFKNSPHGPKG